MDKLVMERTWAPWYFKSQRKIKGRAKLKRADTAGGKTPEMNANVPGEAL
jgi:hypothetical protein